MSSDDITINVMQVGYLGTEEVLVTANEAGEVCVWFTRHGHNIPCVTFSPCGRFAATASVDRTCRTWRLSDGQQIQQKALDPLWGWGVRFVPEESWMTITRAEYRRIPKDHLRPGRHPGLNVRDSPFSATTSTPRRLPPGRDLRMIRTRWYAGPIQEDRARQRGGPHGESGNSRRRPGGAGNDAQANEEMDDRDAALFGMDDDEDEWEDTSSSDADELDGQGEHSDGAQHEQHPVRSRTSSQVIGSGSSTNLSPTSNLRVNIPRLSSMEVSVDTGDDGDNEGTGIDTEDAAGTAGESSSSASRTTGRERKLERRSLLSMKALETQHSRDHGESSSEQEQTTSEAPEAPSGTTPPEPGHTEPEPLAEFQPVVTSTFQNGGPFAKLVRVTPFQKVQTPAAPISSMTQAPQPVEPEFPTELLLCATARNIYLLGPHPLAEAGASVSQEEQTLVSTTMMPYATEVTSITQIEDENDDGEMALTGHSADNRGWHEESEEEENTDHDNTTSHHHHHHSHHGHDDSDYSDDDTGDSDESESDDDGPGSGSIPEHGTSISKLHTLTVARSAATRADGRRYHHLEHFDRLFVMELVPELSILVAASQKGTITIFRLLRVIDDPVASAPPATASGTGAGAGADATSATPVAAGSENSETTLHRDKRHKGKNIDSHGDDKQTTRHHHKNKDWSKNKNRDDKIDTITIKGANYVLFPEMYLPRLEPSPLPLYGVSVVPLQHTAPGSTSRAGKGSSSDLSQSARPNPSPSRSPTLFILHLMYMDSQLFSYELRLRSDKDDPVQLGNIFV
ncbi:hypothetical protein BGX24_009079 [Mortierella sp. AD032]|nr:hypothetical protein BGX24_009079 [Mortierella sp. AD032]